MLHLQAAAAEEGRSVNEIVSERFNSLKDLTASLSDRRAAHCEPPPSLLARKYPAVLWYRLTASTSRLLHFLISFLSFPTGCKSWLSALILKSQQQAWHGVRSMMASAMHAAMAHAHAARDRRGDEPRRPRGGAEGTASDGKAAYLADVKSSSSQMRRPSTEGSLSWRCACPLAQFWSLFLHMK